MNFRVDFVSRQSVNAVRRGGAALQDSSKLTNLLARNRKGGTSLRPETFTNYESGKISENTTDWRYPCTYSLGFPATCDTTTKPVVIADEEEDTVSTENRKPKRLRNSKKSKKAKATQREQRREIRRQEARRQALLSERSRSSARSASDRSSSASASARSASERPPLRRTTPNSRPSYPESKFESIKLRRTQTNPPRTFEEPRVTRVPLKPTKQVKSVVPPSRTETVQLRKTNRSLT